MFSGLLEAEGGEAKTPQSSLLGAIFDSLKETVLFVDPDFKIVWGNKKLLSRAGKDLSSLTGRQCSEAVCGTAFPCSDCPVVRSKITGKQETSTIHSEDGKVFLVRSYPVKPSPELPEGGFVEVALDISGDSMKEADIESQRLKLMQAGKLEALATIISGVAHEINNPLSFMTMNLPLLSECWKDAIPVLDKSYAKNKSFSLARLDYPSMRDELPKLCDDVLSGAMRLKNIISDLKDYMRDDLNDMEEAVDVNRIVEKSLTLTEGLLKKNVRRICVDLKKDVPKAMLNPQKLTQVLVNLLINVSQQASGAKPEMSISTEFDQARARLLIRIRYDGEGAAKEEMEKPFNAFSFGKKAMKPFVLDLSISKKILESISGSLEVESFPEGRSGFTVLLPACMSK